MKQVSFTEFRQQASGMMDAVEQGETIMVMRHGRAVARISPVSMVREDSPVYYPIPEERVYSSRSAVVQTEEKPITDYDMFGMRSDDERSVEEVMEDLRGGRHHDL